MYNSGGIRVPAFCTLGVPGHLRYVLWGDPGTCVIVWGYPGTCAMYSGGIRVPALRTLGVPEYLRYVLRGTRVPAVCSLGVPGHMRYVLWGYRSTYPSITNIFSLCGYARVYTKYQVPYYKRPLAKTLLIGDRSFRAHQGLCWSCYTGFSV